MKEQSDDSPLPEKSDENQIEYEHSSHDDEGDNDSSGSKLVKRGKGKPQIELDQYHLECKDFIRRNCDLIEKSKDANQVRRLKNLNNSMLQRLKKRREQANESTLKKVNKQRIVNLTAILAKTIRPRDMKAILKELKI